MTLNLRLCEIGVGDIPVDTINRYWTIVSIVVTCSRDVDVLLGHETYCLHEFLKH